MIILPYPILKRDLSELYVSKETKLVSKAIVYILS